MFIRGFSCEGELVEVFIPFLVSGQKLNFTTCGWLIIKGQLIDLMKYDRFLSTTILLAFKL